MKIQLATKPLTDITTQLLVLPVFQGEKAKYQDPTVTDFLNTQPQFGKLYENQLIYTPKQKFLLLGFGKKDNLNFEKLQNLSGTAVKQSLQGYKSISLYIPTLDNFDAKTVGEAIVLGAEIASYDPAKDYKTSYTQPVLTQVEIVVDKADRGYQEGFKIGTIMAESINLARKLGDMPPNEMTPTYFLNTAKKIAKDTKLKITIIDEKTAKKKGMGAFTGVAQGSEEPSYIIALEYRGDLKSKEIWGFIGKGVTFDTGGISIKPSSKMEEMKYDMSGAGSVLGTMLSIAKLRPKVNVVAVMAVTENLPGGKAQRPGDIVRSYCGKTAEVINTDAEGRLVLIDALAYAQKDLKATKLVDLATLTGAVIVALGDFYTGAFGNNREFTQRLIEAGASVGEKIWELPLSEEYNKMIQSEFADMTNVGHGGSMPSAAGAITGAKFIEQAVLDNRPWVHLDIAATAWDLKSKPYQTAGATGVGIKTLIKLIS